MTLEKKKFEYPNNYKLIDNTNTNTNKNEFGYINTIETTEKFQIDEYFINKLNKSENEIIIRYS